MFKSISYLTIAAAVTALPAIAGDIMIKDGYARSSNPKVGAVFMELHNAGSEEDRLIEARSEVAARVELHTHIENSDGVMRMVEVEDGFPVPAGGMHILRRGGDHVMLMGLHTPLKDGDNVPLTLVFEKAGAIDVDVAVDNARKDGHGMAGHSN